MTRCALPFISDVVHARVHVHVFVLVVDVVCLMFVLSALVVLLVVFIPCCIYVVSVANFLVGGTLFTPPVGDSNCVGCYRILPL